MTDFIKGAIKRPGALSAAARAAGMSVSAYATKHQHDKGVTGDEARFYLNVLAKVNRGGDKESPAEDRGENEQTETRMKPRMAGSLAKAAGR
jgi:hypothetical protein